MIIRNGGGNKGIKEYLEEGRKVDRHMSRDELDKRIPIEGDLIVTQAVIDTIPDNKQERYLHITMSFNEPDVDEDKMRKVYEEYKSELMHAYGDDEFSIYAEIHWPKVKESYNHNTETMEPRFPHVHIVIPKKNLLTGGFLNPLGMHEKSVKYLDAIQEKLNRDNALSSPRESPRVGFNHYETALGKYKDKEFATKNGEVKRDIHSALIARNIRSVEDFEKLLNEFGEVKTRNAGKATQYFAVKISGDSKFTNLNSNLFTKDYIKDRSLIIDPITDAQVAKRIDSWRTIQSREIKYISNASAKVKAKYRDFTLPERRAFLAERENSYDERYREKVQPDNKRTSLSSLRERNHQSSDFEFAPRGQAEEPSYLHELRERTVDHFGTEGNSTDRLLLSGDADNDLLDIPASGRTGLRPDLYTGGGSRSSQGGLDVPLLPSDSQSCVLTSLLHAENEKQQQQLDLERFTEIRKNLDPQHLLAYAQIKYGIDPASHPVSKAKDGSARIKAGKYNYNVSDFLTKHIGLEWVEASSILTELYDKQQNGITDRPKAKVVLIDDWKRFRDEVYPKNVKTYDQLKNQIRVSFDLSLKTINAEYFARRKTITKDQTLTRSDKHYFRSVVILEKLQKIEALQQRIGEQNSLSNKIKYPYSTLFYDYATKNEEVSMKILNRLKARYQDPLEESINVISGRRPMTPQDMPNGTEAVRRARIVAKLHAQERENKELKLKLGDLKPLPQRDGSVVFNHKDNGHRIFVNHPDRLEMNRKTEPEEVAVGLTFALERFGNPLDIGGSGEFKEQIILVAAERDMDITFTDERLNQALEAKRLELGLEPLVGNTITVPEPELDRALPLNEAVDKALLESRVAELDSVNSQIPFAMVDTAVHAEMVADAVSRHEEIDAGFIDSDRIQEIAREDLDAYVFLQGKPEQLPLALAMAEAKGNGVYSDYINEHGPEEFKLTVDAARFIVQRDGGVPVQQPVTEVPSVEPVRAEAVKAPLEVGRDEIYEAAKQLDDEGFFDQYRETAFDTLKDPQTVLNAVQLAGAEIRSEQFLNGGLSESEKSAIGVRDAKLMSYLHGAGDSRDQAISVIAKNWSDPSYREALQDQMKSQESSGVSNSSVVAKFSAQEAVKDIESAVVKLSAATKAPLEVGRDEIYEAAKQLDDEGFFDQYRETAFDTLKDPQAVLNAVQLAGAEIRSAQVLNGAIPEAEKAEIGARDAKLMGYFRGAADSREQAVNVIANNWSEPSYREALKDQLNRQEAMTVTNSSVEGKFSAQEALKEIESAVAKMSVTTEQAKSAAPEPLTFTHNGEPATIDLERFQPQPQVEQPAPVAEPERQAGPEPLTFTHNGQPATIDLERFQPPQTDEQTMQERNERMAVTERNGLLSNEQKQAEAAAVNDPELLAELRVKHDQEVIESNQNRAEFWANRENAQAQPTQPIEPAQTDEQIMQARNERMAVIERNGLLSNEQKQAEAAAVNDPELLAELRVKHDQEVIESNQNRAEFWENRESAQAKPEGPEPLTFTHNGQPATIDLERFQGQKTEPVAPEQQTPAVAARIIELREVNQAFEKAEPDQVYDEIVRRGTLADANMRHEELDSGFVDSDKIREIASEDLKAFGYLEGKPEQQALALSMGRAMENEHYSGYMTDNAPETVGITIKAATVVSYEQQTAAPTEMPSPTDKDMEL